MSDHFTLKCGICRSCIREGGEERRVGAMSISLWTRVGPWAMVLCGRCAAPLRAVLRDEHQLVIDEIVDEAP